MPEKLTLKELVSVEKLNLVGKDLKHGAVVFDEAKCKGCTLCEIACFTAVIYDSKSKSPKMKKGAEALCVACGACTAICPEGAIEISEFLEFYKYFRWLDRDEPQPPRRF